MAPVITLAALLVKFSASRGDRGHRTTRAASAGAGVSRPLLLARQRRCQRSLRHLDSIAARGRSRCSHRDWSVGVSLSTEPGAPDIRLDAASVGGWSFYSSPRSAGPVIETTTAQQRSITSQLLGSRPHHLLTSSAAFEETAFR
jgi:hypothetical protein